MKKNGTFTAPFAALLLLVIATTIRAMETQVIESYEQGLFESSTLYTHAFLPPAVIADLEKLADNNKRFTPLPLITLPPLFERFPQLQRALGYQSLGAEVPPPLQT